jgi:RND family efflux transporter MFP subunit
MILNFQLPRFSLCLLGVVSCAVWAEPLPPADCVINPHKIIDISSPVAGVLDVIHVQKSDFVKHGQLVAELDASVERASVKLGEARAGIQSEIAEGNVNLEFDQKRQQRIDSLYARQSVSVDNRDDAEREVQLAKVRLQQAKDLRWIRVLEGERAKAQLEQKMIRSPIDGFILETFKYESEYVEDQPVMRVAQLDPLNVEAIVPMEVFGRIKAGMKAKVYTELGSGPPIETSVTVVDRIGNAASGTFGVRLEVANPDFAITAGVSCKVEFLEGDS